MAHSIAELKTLSDRELWRRRSQAAFIGPASVKNACDAELARRRASKSTGHSIKSGSPAYRAAPTRNQAIVAELSRIADERIAVAALERRIPRHTRVVLGPGSTAGSTVAYRIEEL